LNKANVVFTDGYFELRQGRFTAKKQNRRVVQKNDPFSEPLMHLSFVAR
jgi:hypothetical protein